MNLDRDMCQIITVNVAPKITGKEQDPDNSDNLVLVCRMCEVTLGKASECGPVTFLTENFEI